MCPFALHANGNAGLKVLGMQIKVAEWDLNAAFHWEEWYRNKEPQLRSLGNITGGFFGMRRALIEMASDRLQRRQCHSRERTATNPCMRIRVRKVSAAAVRGAAGIVLATVAATVAAVATTVGTAAVGLVGGGALVCSLDQRMLIAIFAM